MQKYAESSGGGSGSIVRSITDRNISEARGNQRSKQNPVLSLNRDTPEIIKQLSNATYPTRGGNESLSHREQFNLLMNHADTKYFRGKVEVEANSITNNPPTAYFPNAYAGKAIEFMKELNPILTNRGMTAIVTPAGAGSYVEIVPMENKYPYR